MRTDWAIGNSYVTLWLAQQLLTSNFFLAKKELPKVKSSFRWVDASNLSFSFFILYFTLFFLLPLLSSSYSLLWIQNHKSPLKCTSTHIHTRIDQVSTFADWTEAVSFFPYSPLPSHLLPVLATLETIVSMGTFSFLLIDFYLLPLNKFFYTCLSSLDKH